MSVTSFTSVNLEERVEASLAKNCKYKSEFFRDAYRSGFRQGFAEGMAEAVLIVLQTRDVSVDTDAYARIIGCTDIDQLEIWLGRAVTVSGTDEIFA